MNDEEMIRKKAVIFDKNQIMVHVTTHKGTFYNGTIMYVGADYFLIHDRELGEMPVFLSEVKVLEPFKNNRQNGS